MSSELAGVLTVLPTPFLPNDAVDLESVAALTDHVITQGSNAIVCFGLASESFTLTDRERNEILRVTVDSADGRVPVVAGTDAHSTSASVDRTRDAVDLGAAAVMVIPPSFTKPSDDALRHHYFEVAGAADGRTLIVQDAPAWTGVDMSIELLSQLREKSGNVDHIKIESPPSAAKIRAAREAGFACIAGYGAVHLLEEARAGACGVMPGAGLVREIVTLWGALERDESEALELFRGLLPILSFQFPSLGVFVAVQKQLLADRGVIASTTVRRPGTSLDRQQRAWLETLVHQAGLDTRKTEQHS